MRANGRCFLHPLLFHQPILFYVFLVLFFSRMVKWMVKELILTLMVMFMKVNGKMINGLSLSYFLSHPYFTIALLSFFNILTFIITRLHH